MNPHLLTDEQVKRFMAFARPAWAMGVLAAVDEVEGQRSVAEAQGHGEALLYLDDLVGRLRALAGTTGVA